MPDERPPKAGGADAPPEVIEAATAALEAEATTGDEDVLRQDPRPIEHIFRWDLDKTYLMTDFDRVRDLVRTALQKPEEKRNVPGALPLLLSLLREQPERRRLVYFVSGSPRQMRKVLERKLALDGIQPHAFILKPNLENILKLRFRAIRAQVGYKLRALLEHQVDVPSPIPETLFGDDAEQDGAIYSIYGEIVSGRLRGDSLARLLKAAEVYSHNAEAILAAAEAIEPGERVKRIFIILDRRSPLSHFAPYAPRLVPVHNYFQAALVLFQDGLLEEADVSRIALDMIARDNFNAARLAGSLQDLVRRGLLQPSGIEPLADALRARAEEAPLARDFLTLFEATLGMLRDFTSPAPTAPAEPPDHAALLRQALTARKQHKEALKQQKSDERQGEEDDFYSALDHE